MRCLEKVHIDITFPNSPMHPMRNINHPSVMSWNVLGNLASITKSSVKLVSRDISMIYTRDKNWMIKTSLVVIIYLSGFVYVTGLPKHSRYTLCQSTKSSEQQIDTARKLFYTYGDTTKVLSHSARTDRYGAQNADLPIFFFLKALIFRLLRWYNVMAQMYGFKI